MSSPLKDGMRYTHLGLTMVVIVLLGLGAGYYVNGSWIPSPWGTLGGLALGVLAGGTWFVLEIIHLMQSSQSEEEDS
jgi:hypothetical protein